MRLSRVLAVLQACQFVQHVRAVAATDTLMDGDSAQSGYLPNHNMDPAVVAGGSFGQIWAYTTPTGASEQFYAKPLVFTPSSTGRQVVLSFSEQNRIYSLDAANGTLVATRDLGLEGEVPFQVSDLGQCNDISGTIGVTGTPVIDPTTDTIYFWAKSYLGTATGYQNGAYRFHAIDAVTLKERPGFPTNIQGTPADNDNTRWFTGGTVLQRPSLNLVNGVVFAGFGGHCDQYNFTGWLVGMSASSGKLLTSYVTSGGAGAPKQDGTFNGGGGGSGIWMAGAGIASDQANRLFFVTGNAYKTEVNQNQPASGRLHLDTLSETVVNMAVNASTGVVTQQDYFEPYTYLAMDAGDRDLGSGGVILPDPGTFSGGGVSRLAITVGKNGVCYVMNADNLGGYKLGSGGTDAIVQTISMPGGGSVFNNAGAYPLEGGWLYITPVGYPTLVYSLGHTSSGLPAFTLVSQTPDTSAARVGTGPATITTLNGQAGTGILWVIDPDAGLRAYNAVPVNGVMTKINLPSSPSVSKYQRPAFGNGRYYISTSNGKILAYGSPVNTPLTCTSPVDFGSVPIGNTKTLNVTCTANIGITSFNGIVLGKSVFLASNSSLPKGALAKGASFNLPVVFDLTNHQLNAGSTSSPQVSPGVQTTSISLLTTNAVAGFATQQPITLTGMSISSAPFLAINPLMVDFDGVVVGSAAAVTGSDSTFIISNIGLSNMTILGLAYTTSSIASANASFYNLTETTNANGTTVTTFDANGYFTSEDMPQVGTVIPGGGSITVDANFNSNVTGTYYSLLEVYSDGGNAYTIFTGSAATVPVALLEYSNGEGGWTTIPHCTTPSAGCTYEIDFSPSPGLTSQTIQLRMSNNGGSALTVTKSKPLEGAVLGATNPDTDFYEGSSVVPGSYELASVVFAPGASVLNAGSLFYSGAWTLNTDDLTFGVHTLNFTGTVVSTQTGPMLSAGNARYKYLGCFQDYINNVRLEPKEYVSAANNTNGLCQTEALAAGMIFAGTEYMQECWVGNIIPSASLQVEDNLCGYACAGDPTQVCGGLGGLISIYYDSTRYFPSNGTIVGASGLAPSIPKTLAGGWQYAGCYSDSATARVLVGKTSAGSTISLDTCATFCSAYSFFGVEYADECYCSNTLATSSVLHADTDCSMNCAANQSEFCGAGSRLSLYYKNGTTIAAPSSTTSTNIALTGTATGSSTTNSPVASSIPNSSFMTLGCYTDNTVTSRALVGAATASASMTLEFCAAYCANYKYFGVEYGDECYCGNALATTTSPATDGRCSMSCASNSAEICGGSYGMNIYLVSTSNSTSSLTSTQSSASVSVSTSLGLTSTSLSSSVATSSRATTSSSVSASPTPSIPATIGQFTYLHCHSDNVTTRTLQGKYIATADMTLENCASNCTGYAYFGVEYARECYCSNVLTYGSYIATDGRCSMKCAGNSLEYCGGSNGLTLYQNITVLGSSSSLSSSMPSSTSSLSSSVLSSVSTLSSSSSSSVLSSVTSSGLSSSTSLVSTSNSISNQQSSTSTPLSSTSMSLSSSVSSSTPVPSSISSSLLSSSSSTLLLSTSSSVLSSVTTTSSSSSLSSLTSSTQVSSTQTSTSLLSSSSSLLSSSSQLSSVSTTSTSVLLSTSSVSTSSSSSFMTVTTSSMLSSSTSQVQSSSSISSSNVPTVTPNPWISMGCANDSTASRALSGSSMTNTTGMTIEMCQAYCTSKNFPMAGVEYASQCYCGTTLGPNSATGFTGCSMACAGNKSEICGGSSRLSVYNNTAFVPPVIPKTVGSYQYTGCYTELSTGRAMGSLGLTNTTGMTVEMCIGVCGAKGTPLAALEYGSQCFCGSSISLSSSVVDDSQCTSMLCPGNSKEWCSAGSRLQMYSTGS
ncbi:WSC-domain-containing protein [Mollisia scopiformis]|uniref:WSC-domain-containing protein n=1 Tax=Mollisia scopiformis TaxID=149040 RepID=A0A194XIE0_MOLSC|nr:WSC-domain-containing protein [Mollisia scopiformis]KUJ19894.1 WSC-domain-containing protein [Mollisia scopiformis]